MILIGLIKRYLDEYRNLSWWTIIIIFLGGVFLIFATNTDNFFINILLNLIAMNIFSMATIYEKNRIKQ